MLCLQSTFPNSYKVLCCVTLWLLLAFHFIIFLAENLFKKKIICLITLLTHEDFTMVKGLLGCWRKLGSKDPYKYFGFEQTEMMMTNTFTNFLYIHNSTFNMKQRLYDILEKKCMDTQQLKKYIRVEFIAELFYTSLLKYFEL